MEHLKRLEGLLALKSISLLLILFMSSGKNVYAKSLPYQTHHIQNLNEEISLPSPTWMLMEGNQSLSIEKILAGNFEDAEVVPVNKKTKIQSANNYWFAIQLTAKDSFKDWLLYFKDVKNDRGYVYGFEYVKVHYVQGNKVIDQKLAGTLVPRSQRDIKKNHTLNLVPISLDSSDTVLVWVNIKNDRTFKFFPKISIHNPSLNYPTYNYTQILVYTSGISIMFLLCLMGLFLYFFTKDPIYGWFTYYTGSEGIYTFLTTPQDPIIYFIPESPKWNVAISILLGFNAVMGFIFFGRRLSELPYKAPNLDKWILYAVTFIVIINLGFILLSIYPELMYLSSFFIVAFPLSTIIITCLFLRVSFMEGFLIRTYGLAGSLYFGSYIIVSILSLSGIINASENINPINLILLGPIFLGVAGLIYRLKENKTHKATTLQLRELDQLKTRLYTNITHEFRTPLTVIQGMTEKIAKKPEKWLPSGIGMIQRNSDQLLRLVNQMLDLSKLESGKLPLHHIQSDIIPFLFYLVESFQSYAETQGIHLQLKSEIETLVMDFDPDRMTDVISNLLSNAIKFTPKGGDVSSFIHFDNESLILKIKDTGIGIPPVNLPHIFDRFYQADDSTTRQREGTGIGLALTKELIQLMGGKIHVKSKKSEGTEFTVILPVTRETALAESFHSQEKTINTLASLPETPKITIVDGLADTTLPKILIIEDNPDVANYLMSCLEGIYQIEVEENGQMGIDTALQIVPNLIISDVMMPLKDGFEVCYDLKNDIRTSHIPIILLTAKADIDSKLVGLRKGADAYLTKPFNEEELLLRIENLLEVRKTLHARYSSDENAANEAIPDIEKEDVFIARFREVVMNHLDNYQLNVSMLCIELGMTRTPLHNKLKALTGKSTTEFVRFIRLTHAKELLTNRNLNVSEVAYQTGFQNHNYFSQKFREVFGQSPKEWRKTN